MRPGRLPPFLLLLPLLTTTTTAHPLVAVPAGSIICETIATSPTYSDGLGLASWILRFGAAPCLQSRQRLCTPVAKYGAAGARVCSEREKYDFECGALGRTVGWVVEACRRVVGGVERSQGRYVFDRGAVRDSAIMVFSG
ncbi:uncharacterized protein H6S33_003881 [Morchella sextelata]|uniref:uncharacterized protein n=1 Tax=Morchella sextelata TaxID=1174677 RepID=UPI001D0504D6|nr:uncharacterized protein H6S33_003881 [Morchella sextelata]KAH0606220.1 hypothetical protein H6S33_003881 [Morchella sextelata]